MGVLTRELAALYGAFRRGAPSPLPELAIQYADYAALAARVAAGERLARQLAWWRGQLAGLPPALELPTDHPRPALRERRGAAASFAIGERARRARRLCPAEGATLFMTLLAGFGAPAALHGQDDLAVGTPIAGRTRRRRRP